ncbi:hypothetical protein CEV33_2029 [Brucella grignonensis]|uniref:Uncharacterized protein n=1 Tax=Brucella grignonensis TaxID=94627 RepID=A0A256F6S6_9HYPH|nr:hypothetical protein CEV33_2029 [Brucella grignonensis]
MLACFDMPMEKISPNYPAKRVDFSKSFQITTDLWHPVFNEL